MHDLIRTLFGVDSLYVGIPIRYNYMTQTDRQRQRDKNRETEAERQRKGYRGRERDTQGETKRGSTPCIFQLLRGVLNVV